MYLPTPGGLTGAPRRLLTLASTLRKRGLSVCLSTGSESDLLKEACRIGIEVDAVDPVGVLKIQQGGLLGTGFWLRIKTISCILIQNLRILKTLKKQSSDIFWTRSTKGIVFGGFGALLYRRPVVWDIDYELPSRGIIHWLHRFGLWSSSAIVFQYKAAPDFIFGKNLSDQYRHKFTSIIPGIELKEIELYRIDRSKKFKNSDDPFIILQVGTVCARKNQEIIIDALGIMSRNGLKTSWELWLAYDDIQLLQFKEKIESLGFAENVKFLGWRDDVKELMVKADILVMPSKDEGVPNAVQEAMAIGLPVLVSDAGGMPEIVVDDETGWVLNQDDPTAWAQKIAYCFDNPEKCLEVGSRAADFAAEYFGTDFWGCEYASVIEKISGTSISAGTS